MSIECSKCGAKTQLYLCRYCIDWLRRQLLILPALIENLKETALGMTKLNNESSRQLGFTSRTPTLNRRAGRLLEEIDSTIGQWARATARIHGLIPSPPITWRRAWDTYQHTTADFAMFLAAHTDKLACDPDIGDLCGSLKRFIHTAVGDEDSDGLMDRRTPPQFCGPCPATIIDHRHCQECAKRPHDCATQLYSKRGELEVTCWVCGSRHRVETLINHLLVNADIYRGTISEIHKVLRMLNEPVKINTLNYWARSHRLTPAGYIRPDGGRIGITRQSDQDEPIYRVSDARKQREDSLNNRRGRPLKEKAKENQ